MNLLRLVFISGLTLSFSLSAYAGSLGGVSVIRISEPEGKAVIRGSDGKLRMVGVGEIITTGGGRVLDEKERVTGSGNRASKRKKSIQPRAEWMRQGRADEGLQLRIVEIVKDRIVLEEMTSAGPEMIIVRLVNGKQLIERVSKTPPKPQVGVRQKGK